MTLEQARDLIRPALYQAVSYYPWSYMLDGHEVSIDRDYDTVCLQTHWKAGHALTSKIRVNGSLDSLAPAVREALRYVLPGLGAEEEAAIDYDTPVLGWKQ